MAPKGFLGAWVLKALLETDELIFRGGDLRLSIPYRSISRLDAANGTLCVTSTAGVAAFELGAAAPKWADKIRNPPRRIDKLGVKPGQRVVLVGLCDVELHAERATVGILVVTAEGRELIRYSGGRRVARTANPGCRTLTSTEAGVAAAVGRA